MGNKIRANAAQYPYDLARAEADGVVHVSEAQFAALAKAQQWDDETIRLLLLPPVMHKTFLMGRVAYRIREK